MQEKYLDANEPHFIVCGPRESVQQSYRGRLLVVDTQAGNRIQMAFRWRWFQTVCCLYVARQLIY